MVDKNRIVSSFTVEDLFKAVVYHLIDAVQESGTSLEEVLDTVVPLVRSQLEADARYKVQKAELKVKMEEFEAKYGKI